MTPSINDISSTGDYNPIVAALKARAKHEAPAVIISDFGKLFPPLTWHTTGLSPWEPLVLDKWAASGGPSSGTVSIVRFLFAVWNGSETEWKVGPFRLADLRNFDPHALAIFRAWLADPFWL